MTKRFKDFLIRSTPDSLAALLSNDDLRFTYGGSDIFRIIAGQKERGESVTVLFTDIDRTFYRADKQQAAQQLTAKAQQKGWPIVAITGNGYQGVLDRIMAGELPYFQVIAGSVGTEIWVLHHNQTGQPQYRQDRFFQRLLLQSGFIRPELSRRSRRLVERFRTEHPDWQFEFQDPAKEQQLLTAPDPLYQPFKISFYFFSPSDFESLQQVTQEVSQYFPQQSIITCGEINYNRTLPPDAVTKKYCLDLLASTKSGALNYLRHLLGVQKGIVAGDSGNDVDMLVESGILSSVLVGGYEPAAKVAIDQALAAQRGGRIAALKQLFFRTKRVDVERDGRSQAAESILRAADSLENKTFWHNIKEKGRWLTHGVVVFWRKIVPLTRSLPKQHIE